MKNLTIFFLLIFSSQVFAQNGLKKFFSPIPKPSSQAPPIDGNNKKQWEWRPIVSLPALKLTKSSRPSAEVDALLLTSTGGGISIQKIDFDGDNKAKSTFSWSPITILLSGNLSAENPIDISAATTVGFFNNLLMVGGGYDLGSVNGRGRWFGLVSIGINFNN